ncbi:MAG: hypothetical protein UHI81_00120 [Olegusella sp.]|nr:hypothetical protein [Olegusella sp.]
MDESDFNDLRESLIDYCGTAAVSGFSAAWADMAEISSLSGEELLEKARELGIRVGGEGVGSDDWPPMPIPPTRAPSTSSTKMMTAMQPELLQELLRWWLLSAWRTRFARFSLSVFDVFRLCYCSGSPNQADHFQDFPIHYRAIALKGARTCVQ